MSELLTTGRWRVEPGHEAAFVEAWTAFAEWASTMPGAGTLRLGRDTGDPHLFTSFAPWRDAEAVRGWKSDPGFRDRMAQVMQHVADFDAAELDVVARCTAGSHV